MDAAEPHPLMPQLRLDDLLAELQVRLQAVLDTRDRMHCLLEAVVAVGGEPGARGRAAADRGGCGHAGGRPVRRAGGRSAKTAGWRSSSRSGLDEDEIAGIDHWPEGRGLLGELVTDPQTAAPRRDRQRTRGRPGSPRATRRCGRSSARPIRVRDKVFGNLYLTEKRGGGRVRRGRRGPGRRAGRRGGRGDRERPAVRRGAPAAAVAAGQRRGHHAAAVRRRAERRCSSSITQQALEMSGADLVVLALPDGDGAADQVEHAAGAGAGEALGLVLPTGARLSGQVMATRHAGGDRGLQPRRAGRRWLPGEQLNAGPARSCSRWARPATSAAC